MKGLMVSLVSLLFFISLSAARALDHPAVVDTDGDPLRPGVKYYASFFIWPGNGGVSIASTSYRTCPSSVIQRQVLPIDPDNGDPVTFQLATTDGGDGIIRESSDVNIKFEGIANAACPNETLLWRVNWDASLNGKYKYDVSVDGRVGDSLSVFKIEKYAMFSYKFVYCFGEGTCKSVSRVAHDGQTRLVINDDEFPFVVVFFKVKEPKSVLQLPKSEPNTHANDFCPPGKWAWPELVGKKGEEAVEIIQKENPLANPIILKPGQLRPASYVCGRVFVNVNLAGIVTRTPMMG